MERVSRSGRLPVVEPVGRVPCREKDLATVLADCSRSLDIVVFEGVRREALYTAGTSSRSSVVRHDQAFRNNLGACRFYPGLSQV
jgi:hypothetical protein